ncbi:hypothetical protein CGRA01v4_09851 [Colletotrichum graminicola]|nr:hypothetical protein CGRA01v4_09851 [Colletotrichum graminicola]
MSVSQSLSPCARRLPPPAFVAPLPFPKGPSQSPVLLACAALPSIRSSLSFSRSFSPTFRPAPIPPASQPAQNSPQRSAPLSQAKSGWSTC